MAFKTVTCGNCYEPYTFYQHLNIVPPCPTCGYPEIKTSEQYLKSMGVSATTKRDLNKVKTCGSLFDCCSCGGEGCGCAYCYDCHACENCKNDNSEECEHINYND